jgi:hypothetical protein
MKTPVLFTIWGEVRVIPRDKALLPILRGGFLYYGVAVGLVGDANRRGFILSAL